MTKKRPFIWSGLLPIFKGEVEYLESMDSRFLNLPQLFGEVYLEVVMERTIINSLNSDKSDSIPIPPDNGQLLP